MATRRREDRLHDDRYKLWVPEKPADRDYDQRRHRSRAHPQYSSATPSASYQPGPSSTSKPRSSSAQYPSTGYHSATQTPAPSNNKGYPLTASSRRAQPEPIDSRSHRRPAPTPKSSYEHVSATEDLGRSSRQTYSSRPVQPQTTANSSTPSTNWPSSAQDIYSKRSKDRDQERDRHREMEKERDRERASAELDRHRERHRSEQHREKEKADRQREQTRHRREKRIESDSEGLIYSDKASISGREAYQPSIRESIASHRRHRTEDGVSLARRPHAEPSHHQTSAVHTQSTGPQQETVIQSNGTGVGSNPPPAPRVMPVYLPHKPSKSHHERHTSSAAQGAQSGSDTERASLKHRVERNHSGGPVQRGDGYQTSVVRERQGQDAPVGPREDAKSKSEAKYTSMQGTYYDSRQPLKPTSIHTVDIPLITPGFNSSPLPHESRGHVGTIPVLVAGEGPADRQAHDVLYKSQSPLPKDELHGAGYPHVPLASAVKPSHGRSQSSEVPRSRPEQPPLDRSRTDPAIDILNGRHHRPEDLTPPRYPLISTPVEHQPSQPRSRKTSFSNPPAVSGPRPQRSSSFADNQNESIRPTPSSGLVASSQPHTTSSAAHKTNSSPPKIGLGYGSLPSAHPTPTSSQTHLASGIHGNNATGTQRSPSTPPAHSTSMNTSQTTMTALHPPRASRTSLDRPEPHVVAPRMTTAQISNGSTVKSSWVVQTAQPLKDGYAVREEKHSGLNGSHQVDPPTVAHPQLREVLSQDNRYTTTPANRPAPTPNSSLRSSPYGTPKEVHAAGTPRRSPDSSPRMLKVKEAATPEQPKYHLFPAPPQIAVIGATPLSANQELPYKPPHNSGFLAPSYSAPSRVSRTVSGSRDHPTQVQVQPQTAHNHAVGSTASFQQASGLQPVVQQAPSPSSYGSLPSPSFPAPSRVSRTTSGSRDHPQTPTVHNHTVDSVALHQQTPTRQLQSVTPQTPASPYGSLPAPSFPAPSQISRTTSGSREQPPHAQPQTFDTHPVVSTASQQQTPVRPSQSVVLPSQVSRTTSGSRENPSHGQSQSVHAVDSMVSHQQTPGFAPQSMVLPSQVLRTTSGSREHPSNGQGSIAAHQQTAGFSTQSVAPQTPASPHGGLPAPSYPAPSQISKTTSGSRDHPPDAQPQTVHPVVSIGSHQQTPGFPFLSAMSQAPSPSSYGQFASAGQFSPPPLPVPPPRVPGIDIPEDIFPVRLAPSSPAGINPTPTSAAVPLQPAPAPVAVHTSAMAASGSSAQPSLPNGHVDSYKSTPWTGEGKGGATPATASSAYQKAAAPAPTISREASLAAPTLPSAGTGPTSGVNQGMSGSQHPAPIQGAPPNAHPLTDPAPRFTRPKVTIEEVPESPQFGNKWTENPSPTYPQTQTHVPAQGSEAPVPPSSVPAAKVQSSDLNAHGKAPLPVKPKDLFVPSVQPTPSVQPIPTVKPSLNVQPSPAVKPGPSAQPTSSVQPSPSVQPTSSVQPSPTVKPSLSVQPNLSLQPTPTAKPSPGVQLTPTAKPSPGVQPTPTAKPSSGVQPTPTAVAPTPSHVPPAPSTQPHAYTSTSSRAPFSAPPSQTTFAPSHQDPVHRTTSSGGQPRGYQRSTDAQSNAKAPPTYTSASAMTTQDAVSKGRTSAATPTATATAPHPPAEIYTKSHPSRPLTSAAAAAQTTRPVALPLNTTQNVPVDAASKGSRQYAAVAASAVASHPHNAEAHAKPYSSRPVVPPVTIPQGPSVRAAASTPSAKIQVQDPSNTSDSTRYRGLLSSASRYASAMNPLYPASHRHATPASANQQLKPSHSTHPIPHHRTVSLPTPQPVSTSNANTRPPSPRKISQPLVNSNSASTQPFPSSSQGNVSSRPFKTAEPSWAARVAVSGHPSTPAPSRAHLPPAMNRAFSQESEILMTPSSIAPSMPKTPQTPQTSFTSPQQATAPPMRQRQVSTESKESKRKPGGFLGGLFRTMSGSGSSKALESPVARTPKLSMEQHKSPAIVAPPMQHSKSSSSPKESKDEAVTSARPGHTMQTTALLPSSASVQPKAPKDRARKHPENTSSSAHPIRDRKQPSSNVFSPFSFLTSKRNRTMSGASLDVCDGNTATNTVIGSPAHSTVSQVQPLPPMVPPPSRDPMVATSQWRDREEAEQKRRKKSRPRPGVTFDVEEDPPDPYPGAIGRQKGARLVRRKTGRSATPGPP